MTEKEVKAGIFTASAYVCGRYRPVAGINV
jgi:hypothetical protein